MSRPFSRPPALLLAAFELCGCWMGEAVLWNVKFVFIGSKPGIKACNLCGQERKLT